MNNRYTDTWDFKDKHLDPNIDAADANKFMSSARCILYAAPADKTGSKSEFVRIGVVQGYNWGENKQVDMIFELGSDIPYFIPGRTTGQISIQRILLSGQDLLNLIYNADARDGKDIPPDKWIRSIRDVNIPLDLMFSFYGQGKTGKYDSVYSRFFKNCWITSRQESINSGQILVAEGVSLVYEYCSNYIYAS